MNAYTATASARRVGGAKRLGIPLSFPTALANDLAITACLPRFARWRGQRRRAGRAAQTKGIEDRASATPVIPAHRVSVNHRAHTIPHDGSDPP